MPRVLFTESAHSDLLDAWLFIAQESLDAADRVIDAIHQDAITLSLQPLMGRLRVELAKGVRSWPTSTRYILFYLPSVSGITVLRVLHHARDIQNIQMDI
ncbi:MAG: type II toxin-antitoxin system RelE/ParE family toxin [Limnohabitans sp.]|jgi:toxin ParE1/3/4|nr:type II toxin-antitoxin system RelE/ParE family toxin [Burkholderiales bacterium]